MPSAAEALAEHYAKTQPLMITEGITHKQMARLLRDAAAEAEQRVLALGGSNVSDVVGRIQARQIALELQGVSTEVWKGTGRITQAGMYAQAHLAADQQLDLELLNGMPAFANLQYANALHFEAAQGVEDVISHRTNGFTLQERLYANGRVSTKQVGVIVDKALLGQLSAKQLAAQVKQFYNPNVHGGISYTSMRLARTEINNAHHDTTKRLSQDKPWIFGFKWNLSESHPKPDACNAYADHDEGMGPGVFNKADTPNKPHPQCLCYLTHVMDEDEVFVQKLTSGQYDTYLDSRGVSCGGKSNAGLNKLMTDVSVPVNIVPISRANR